MVDKPEVRSIPTFYLGGAIPKAAVGDVLEAVLLGGGKISEVSPIFPDVVARPARIERKPTKLLPPPADKPKRAGPKRVERRNQLFEAMARALLKGPLTRQQLIPEIVAAGTSKGNISNTTKLETRGLLKRNAKGEFSLTTRGRKQYERILAADTPAVAKQRGDTKSQKEIVREMLSQAFPGEVTYSALAAEFQKRKLRKGSISVALNKMQHDKEAKKGTTKGSWLFIPPTSNSEQQQAA